MTIRERDDAHSVNGHAADDLVRRGHQHRPGAHARHDAEKHDGLGIDVMADEEDVADRVGPMHRTSLYLDAVKKSWEVVTSCFLLGLALGLLAALLATPQYRSTSQVFIAFQSTDNSPVSMLQGASFSQQQVISYADIVTSPLVLQPVIDNLGLDEDPEDLADRVEASTRRETVLIDIAVTDTSPRGAARIADEIAASLGEVISQLERPDSTNRAPVEVTTVRPAVVPTSPSAPNSVFLIAVGGALGLSVGVAYSLFAHSRRT